MTAKILKEMSSVLSAEVSDEEWAEAEMDELWGEEVVGELTAAGWVFERLKPKKLQDNWSGLARICKLTAENGELMDQKVVDLGVLLWEDELPERESLADRRFAAKQEVETDFRGWLQKWQNKKAMEGSLPLLAAQVGLSLKMHLKCQLWEMTEDANEDKLLMRIQPYGVRGMGVDLEVLEGEGIWKEARAKWEGVHLDRATVLAELGVWVVQKKDERSTWELTC